jgi:hypothetical protein
MASYEAVGMSTDIEVAGYCGNVNPICVARRYPSGQFCYVGVPRTCASLKIWSFSFAPGARGRDVYSSLRIQPMANMSTGEL